MHRALQIVLGALAGSYAGAAIGFAVWLVFVRVSEPGFWDALQSFFEWGGAAMVVGLVVGAGLMAWQSRPLTPDLQRELRKSGQAFSGRAHPAGKIAGALLGGFFAVALLVLLALPAFGLDQARSAVPTGILVVVVALGGGFVVYAVACLLATRTPPPLG